MTADDRHCLMHGAGLVGATILSVRGSIVMRMKTEDSTPNPEIRPTEIVGGTETSGLSSLERITAGQLTDAHVGRLMGCHDEERGVNYQARILKFQRYETGNAPGVSLWLRHSLIPDRPSIPGRDAYEDRIHVPFESEIEIVDLVAM